MKEEIKQRWVAALKSGEYKQGLRNLKTPGEEKYCCLGVLCDLYHKETGLGEWTDKDFIAVERGSGALPPVVRDWAGLTDNNPVVVHNNLTRSLAFLNDGRNGFGRLDFSEIANVINNSL